MFVWEGGVDGGGGRGSACLCGGWGEAECMCIYMYIDRCACMFPAQSSLSAGPRSR